MRRIGLSFSLLAMLMGCGADIEPPDGPDAGDGTMARSGLVLAFSSDPSVGESTGGDFGVVLNEIEIGMEHVRVIGDSAPGDERTSITEFRLEWERDDTIYLRFTQAPPGMYSQLLADVVSYEISGTIEMEDQARSFAIKESSANISISAALADVTLEPSMGLEIPVRVAVHKIIDEINWSEVEEGEEEGLSVDESSPQIGSVRSKIKEMFSAQAAQPIEQ